VISWKDISALPPFLSPLFCRAPENLVKVLRYDVVRPVGAAACAATMLLFSVCDVRSDTPPPGVQDVRGFKIRDSGYIAPNPNKRVGQYWIDNDRILFIGSKSTAPRKKAPVSGQRESELRLHLWDMRTNQVTVHHDADLTYGNLCVKDQLVVLRYGVRVNQEKNEWRSFAFEGSFGQEKLSEVEIPKPTLRRDVFAGREDTSRSGGPSPEDRERIAERRRSFVDFNYLTCRPYRRSELPASGEYVRPLLPGEFVTRQYVQDDEQARNNLPGTYLYHPRGGGPVRLKLGDKDAGVGRYFSYMDSYVLGEISTHVVISEKVPRKYGLMDRKGKIRDFTPPSGPWMNSTTHIAPTQRGMFLTSNAISGGGSNGAGGAFLLIEERLMRLIPGLPESFDISPNGCRVALAISDATVDVFTSRLKMLDLCTKGD